MSLQPPPRRYRSFLLTVLTVVGAVVAVLSFLTACKSSGRH